MSSSPAAAVNSAEAERHRGWMIDRDDDDGVFRLRSSARMASSPTPVGSAEAETRRGSAEAVMCRKKGDATFEASGKSGRSSCVRGPKPSGAFGCSQTKQSRHFRSLWDVWHLLLSDMDHLRPWMPLGVPRRGRVATFEDSCEVWRLIPSDMDPLRPRALGCFRM